MAFSAIVVIAANTMNGPGLTTLPQVGESAGLVTFVVLTTVSMSITAFVVYVLCKLIWTHQKLDHQIEGPKLENSDIVALSGEAWGGKRSSKQIASIAMVGCALALALAQMMLCAKIADAMIVASFDQACGITPIPSSHLNGQFVHCKSNLSMKPFSSTQQSDVITTASTLSKATKSVKPPMFLVTAGLVLSSSITISLASVDQSSMITAQYVLFGCLILACVRFCYTLSIERCNGSDPDGDNDNSNSVEGPSFFLGSHPFEAVGSILFNFAFVVTVPPLACDAHGMNESIHALITAITIMGLLYSILGWIGAPAAAACSSTVSGNGDGDDTNLLSLVLKGRQYWDIVSVIIFGLSQLAAIPVYCELARETLDAHIQYFVAKPRTSFWLCHAAPW